jgi:chromosomal replication initiation ATPase DnaA
VRHQPTKPVSEILAELDVRDLAMLAIRVAGAHWCSLDEMVGPRRVPRFVVARQHLWAELYDTGVFSLPVLGRIFDRDHKTIWHGIREHGNRAEAARLRARRCV